VAAGIGRPVVGDAAGLGQQASLFGLELRLAHSHIDQPRQQCIEPRIGSEQGPSCGFGHAFIMPGATDIAASNKAWIRALKMRRQ
jgi:hypothetical protein